MILGILILIVFCVGLRGAYLVVRDKQVDWESERRRTSNKKRQDKLK